MINVIKFRLLGVLKKSGFEGVPYRELAKKMGVDHVSLWKMMNGKPYNPSLAMLDKICLFLKCSPGDLLEHKK